MGEGEGGFVVLCCVLLDLLLTTHDKYAVCAECMYFFYNLLVPSASFLGGPSHHLFLLPQYKCELLYRSSFPIFLNTQSPVKLTAVTCIAVTVLSCRSSSTM